LWYWQIDWIYAVGCPYLIFTESYIRSYSTDDEHFLSDNRITVLFHLSSTRCQTLIWWQHHFFHASSIITVYFKSNWISIHWIIRSYCNDDEAFSFCQAYHCSFKQHKVSTSICRQHQHQHHFFSILPPSLGLYFKSNWIAT
jgi:hypothetical protein